MLLIFIMIIFHYSKRGSKGLDDILKMCMEHGFAVTDLSEEYVLNVDQKRAIN